MMEVNALRKGTTFTHDGELFKVLEFTHNKTGRGGATIRTKVVNLRTGAIYEKTFTGGERVEDISLDHTEAQYLYNDGELYHFMDTETYEQPVIPADILGEGAKFLKENIMVELLTYEGKAIEVELPTTVDLKVAETAPGYKGDTASGGGKPATLETGVVVTVPFFVNVGDTVRVDTRDGSYVTRV